MLVYWKLLQKELCMKKSKILKMIIICLAFFGLNASLNLDGNNWLLGNEQYVQVDLKDGSSLTFEYESFMNENFIFPEELNKPAKPGEVKTFGEKRIHFKEKNTCKAYSISLDNLVELEVLDMDKNNCDNKKSWLFKIYLFDLEKYEGFLTPSDHNAAQALIEHNVKGILLESKNPESILIGDIKKISFFSR
jgi:hypothetical protein